MTMRELVCDAFDSTVDGIAKKCEIDGSKIAAVELGADVFAICNQIVSSISDDGKIDDSEKEAIKASFRASLATRVPDESFWFLGTAWSIVKSWIRNLQTKLTKRS